MKKILYSVAAALAVVACGGKNNVEVPAAKQEAHACVVEVTGTPVETRLPSGYTIAIQKIEFMRDGYYLGQGIEILKSDASVHYFSGTYTVSGEEYHLSGDFSGNVKIEDTNLTFKPAGEDPVVTSGTHTVTTPPTNPVEQALFVNWKIKSLEAVIDRPAVKHKFIGSDASDLGAIASYINEKQSQVQLDLETFSKYIISTICLSPNSVMVNFTDQTIEPIIGNWQGSGIDITTQTFKYKLNAELDGKLFQTEASGSFAFNSDFTTVTITLEVESEDLSGKIIITADKA